MDINFAEMFLATLKIAGVYFTHIAFAMMGMYYNDNTKRSRVVSIICALPFINVYYGILGGMLFYNHINEKD